MFFKSVQERDEQIRKHREESMETEKRLQVQLEEREAHMEELMEKLERQNERKEELKQELQQKDTELEEIKKAYRCSVTSYAHVGVLQAEKHAYDPSYTFLMLEK